jgi:PBP1b-binding outer membrane lipoprotein LpoB
MKIKVIVLLLVLGAVLLSGCVDNQQPSPVNNTTPGENVTSGGNATPEETVNPEEDVTAGENVTQVVNETPEVNVTTTTGSSGAAHLIRLANYRATPSSLEIKKGETVSWMNFQDNPKRKFTLVSQEGLFEDKTLVYRQPFAYTFNDTGNYNFTVVGQPRMNVSISVAAS